MVEGAAAGAGILPRVNIKADDALAIALRLARAGYGGGDPEKVMEMPADIVMAAVQYENYVAVYERTYIKLNEGRPR